MFARNNIKIRDVCKILIFFCAAFIGCSEEKKSHSPTINFISDNNWYKQSSVDLGAKIRMISPSLGYAISRGRGDIEGHVYKFIDGKWNKIFSFPYSDFPQLHAFDKDRIWFVNHLTHNGAYQPIFNQLNQNIFSTAALPKLMWDEVDFAMMKSLFVNSDGTAWMAGQQGYFLFYNGKIWKQFPSPIIKDSLTSLLAGDINSIFMIDDSLGWAVGKDGVILKFTNNRWNYFSSPVRKNLHAVQFINKKFGWIIGESGVILKFENDQWYKVDLDHSHNLFSLKILQDSTTYFCGDKSTLLKYKDENWYKDLTIANFEENFSDLDIVLNKQGEENIWLIGKDGIYTNSQTLGFSFSKITEQSGLPDDIRSGAFYKNEYESPLNFFALNEGSASILYEKTSADNFKQKLLLEDALNPLRETSAFAIADVNNDGIRDLFQFYNKNNYSLLLGNSGGSFYDWTSRSNLSFEDLDFPHHTSARFIDLDNDGNLDLYLFSQEGDDLIFKNNGAAQFNKIQINSLNKKNENSPNGIVFSDLNNDNLVDLLITYSAPVNKAVCEIYLNKSNFSFEQKIDPAFFLPNESSVQTTSSLICDFNNDTYNDILIYNQRDKSWLLINDGKCNFNKVFLSDDIIPHSEDSKGVVNAADINNDGLLDLFVSSKLFLNKGDLKFEEISENVGVNFLGNPIFEDIDDDGDIDLFIGSSKYSLGKGERSALFRNNSLQKNFIKFNIEGSRSNRSAIGTKIIVAQNDGDDTLYQMREVGLGNSPLGSQNISTITFGVTHGKPLSAKIIFPSGKNIIVNDLILNSTLTVSESNSFSSIITAIQKSLRRTFLLVDNKKEALRFILVLAFFFLLLFTLKKKLHKKVLMHWAIILFAILAYLIHVHLTVHLSFADSLMYGSLYYVLSVVLLIAIVSLVFQKNEEKHFSHFKIISLLGEGGMGKVFKAFDTSTKKITALKILHPHLLDDAENKKRFNSEGQILASMDHENIVRVYEIGQVNGHGFISLELCQGKTLKQYIRENFPISESEIINIAVQLCEGLAEIHSKNIIHRDLKSNNIIIDGFGKLKIMDFGLSKSPIVTSMSSLGSVIGTLGYVSPEQITNSDVDNRADIFSLGVILYELSTNKIPFNGENEIALIHSIFNEEPPVPSAINNALSKELDQIVMKALSKNKGERFNSAEEMISNLRKINLSV